MQLQTFRFLSRCLMKQLLETVVAVSKPFPAHIVYAKCLSAVAVGPFGRHRWKKGGGGGGSAINCKLQYWQAHLTTSMCCLREGTGMITLPDWSIYHDINCHQTSCRATPREQCQGKTKAIALWGSKFLWNGTVSSWALAVRYPKLDCNILIAHHDHLVSFASWYQLHTSRPPH